MPTADTLGLHDDTAASDIGIVERLENHSPFAGLVALRIDLKRPVMAIHDGRNRKARSRRGVGGCAERDGRDGSDQRDASERSVKVFHGGSPVDAEVRQERNLHRETMF